ncbi:MAG TPA: aldolase/citrate lyase family protein [Marinobacter sp.]|uniref:HpcH/HpaI aldolase family protein n=1 Tax=Marinobacter sp. TaxID=50741 RepID=UPI002D7EF9FE|nr:aldolase/citrate lyase family protein [Marinobacter sp.]HET8799892.1 aldolase/citrate lyase family protein [Marinobacter sp.]
MLTINRTRQTIARGHAAYGLLNAVPTPWMVEMIGYAGYDFVILDTEHMSTNPESLEHMIRAAECASVTPLVRVPGVDRAAITRALDSGAQGIVVPRVNTVEEARDVVQMARYAPVGQRGITGGRTTGFGTLPLKDYLHQANQEVLIVLMIESQEGMDNRDAILSVPGVDWALPGAVDLSQSLGCPGDPFHPSVTHAITELATSCRGLPVEFCTLPRNSDQLTRWHEWGARVFLLGEDRSLLFRHLKSYLASCRSEPGPVSPE